MAMMDDGPAPIQTMKIGPRAVFGSEFRTTRYGSRSRDRNGLRHNATAISVPETVPRINPTTVSRQETPMCVKSSPEA